MAIKELQSVVWGVGRRGKPGWSTRKAPPADESLKEGTAFRDENGGSQGVAFKRRNFGDGTSESRASRVSSGKDGLRQWIGGGGRKDGDVPICANHKTGRGIGVEEGGAAEARKITLKEGLRW